MVDKTQQIYTSTEQGAFEEMLYSALLQVDACGVIKLAIFHKPANDSEYKQSQNILVAGQPAAEAEHVAHRYVNDIPK